MSQSAENTPVSNQTPAVRKSLYSNAGNFIYHSLKLHALTESIFCTHTYIMRIRNKALQSQNSNNNYSYVG